VSIPTIHARRGWLVLGTVVLVVLAMSHWSCEVPPLMAPGSSIQLIANPKFIAANGGVSVITAIVSEPAGTFAPDGSVVLFFTNLGRIDPQGKTVNGVARVNLISDSRSGEATITGLSSGGAPAPPASGSASGGASGTGQDTETVMIGSALPDHLIVTADPARIRGPGSATIVANVFDIDGNPVANVPVIFQITSTSPVSAKPQETLESGGRQRFTDTNGQAFDTLITRAVSGVDVVKLVTVTATAANDKNGDVQVGIN
jgi:hypothetical protein